LFGIIANSTSVALKLGRH